MPDTHASKREPIRPCRNRLSARLTLNTGWFNTSMQLFEGNATAKESNIKTGYFYRIVGHDSAGTSFVSDTTGKALKVSRLEKPVSEAAREFRVRVWLNGHAVVSTFSISFSRTSTRSRPLRQAPQRFWTCLLYTSRCV